MFSGQSAFWYIFRDILQKQKMLSALIIFVRKLNFVKLCRNRLLKNIFETTLCCTVSTVGEMHETILSITGKDLEPLQHVRWSSCVNSSQLSAVKNCHNQFHFTCCSAKLILYFNLFLFQMVSSKYYIYVF